MTEKLNGIQIRRGGLARGRPFMAGQSGNPRGRLRGVPNNVTQQVREAAAEIIDNPSYRANLTRRAIDGELAPAVEVLLWHYAKGVPKVVVDARVVDVTKMATEDLRLEMAQLLARL